MEVTFSYFWDMASGGSGVCTFGVTCNGEALTAVVANAPDLGSGADAYGVRKFILKEADLPTDAAHDVVVTITSPSGDGAWDIAVVCRHLGDVEQTTTTRDTDGSGNASAQTATATPALTTVSGDLVTDGLCTYTTTRTKDGSQTELGTQVDGTDNTDCHTSYLVASGVSTTVGWTFTSQEYGHVAVAYIEDLGSDVTAPVLSSPTATATNSTTGSGSVSTDEGNGTLYWVVTTSATEPSVAQVQAGQDHTGSAAADSGSQAVSGTGVQNVSGGFTSLTAATTYYAHYQQQDAATNDSEVVASSSFTTTVYYVVTELTISPTVG